VCKNRLQFNFGTLCGEDFEIFLLAEYRPMSHTITSLVVTVCAYRLYK